MSKDALTTQDTQSTGDGASANSPAPETYGLRADLHAQIMRMSPADAGQLADMIVLYPSFMGAILMVAASHMGNAAVQRAMQIAKQKQATQGRGGSMNQEELHNVTRDESDSKPIKHSEYASFLNDSSDAATHAEPEVKAAPAAKHAEPAWAASARAYNDAHPDLVAEFNDLTNDMCCDDDDGKLDPQAVASWQGHHGLPADGKVGPHTVAAAKAAKTPAAPVAGPSPAAAAAT